MKLMIYVRNVTTVGILVLLAQGVKAQFDGAFICLLQNIVNRQHQVGVKYAGCSSDFDKRQYFILA